MQETHRRTRNLLVVLALIFFAAPAVKADNFSFSGTFSRDDDARFFAFTLGAASPVTLRTWSYAGGTNAAGVVIPAGGFDPVLSLFNAGGLLINSNDDRDAGTRDAFLSLALQPGQYTLAITQYDNFAAGPFLANGFPRAIKLGNENRPWFETDASWEGLRDDPRFRQLMERIEASQQRARENVR